MWEVSLEVQKTADLGLSAIPAVNVCVCVWRSVHTHICPQAPHLEGLALFINGSVIGARHGVCVGAQRAVASLLYPCSHLSVLLFLPTSLLQKNDG